MLWRKQGRRDSRSASFHVEVAQDSKGSSHGDSIEGLRDSLCTPRRPHLQPGDSRYCRL